MKSTDYVTILAGAVLAFVAFKTFGKGTGTAQDVFNAAANKMAAAYKAPSSPMAIDVSNSAGWQYFTDGTAIAPNGDYYYQGSLVYKANA